MIPTKMVAYFVAMAGFCLIVIAAERIGRMFTRFNLPLISGFLLTGMLAGPFVFGFLSEKFVTRLDWVAEISLGFIAFSAGGELSLRELRSRMRNLGLTTTCLVLSTLLLGGIATFFLAGTLSATRDFSTTGRVAIALLAVAILVARSPSSAVAVIQELRSKGPFTQTVLGVTVIMDAVVITLFALNSSVADALLNQVPLNLGFAALVLVELSCALLMGYVIKQLLQGLFAIDIPQELKAAGLLLAGYTVFIVTHGIRLYSNEYFSSEVFIEPLLVCMVGGFLLRNAGSFQDEFRTVLHRLAPAVFVAFFTLVGASLELDVLGMVWHVAIVLFAVRMIAIYIGSYSGGLLSGEPSTYRHLSWTAYVTQAGVGLGLAQEVAMEFPGWGEEFATMMTAVIVLNQFIGPVLFKWTLVRIGEARPPAKKSEVHQIPVAVIFGTTAEAMELSYHLQSHDWQVRNIDPPRRGLSEHENTDEGIEPFQGLSRKELEAFGVDDAGAVVMLLSDEQNYRICEAIRRHFDGVNLVATLRDLSNGQKFRDLGVHTVSASTATVSLLDHYVRAPSVVSLLHGETPGREVGEIEVVNQIYKGHAIRDLELPKDIMFLGIFRGENLRMER